MRDLAILFIHLIVTITRLIGPGGARSVVAESFLVKHQLVILNRGRERAPKLRPMDRVMAGVCTLAIRPGRLLRIAVALKPSTLLVFHAALVKRKYRQLFSPKRRGKPGPKGPSPEIIAAIVETKRPNPSWGCRRIAQQLCEECLREFCVIEGNELAAGYRRKVALLERLPRFRCERHTRNKETVAGARLDIANSSHIRVSPVRLNFHAANCK